MTPFTRHAGRAAVLPLENIDTDQILPARFLKKPRSAGYGNFLFHDLRRDETGGLRSGFPLDAAGEPPSIIVAGSNFGCGSSREGAVYALVDGGIRAVISSRIADIFRNNAVRNGLVPVEMKAERVADLLAVLASDPAEPVTVDLQENLVHVKGKIFPFEMDEANRRRLLLGLDDIAETSHRLPMIEAAESAYHQRRFWSLPATQRS